jgi:hypothetical protein
MYAGPQIIRQSFSWARVKIVFASEITFVKVPVLFDEQLSGPYAFLWHHITFEATENGTK